MYQITKELLNDIFCIHVKNKKTNEIIEIVPSFGANVNKLVLEKNGILYSVLKSHTYSSEFEKLGIFNNAKLFPFPNRIDKGKFEFENVQYILEKNYSEEGNACHGFVYNQNFEIVNQTIQDDYAEITLGFNYEKQIKGYPFPFNLEVTYKLSQNGFEAETKVKNVGFEAMPFGDGWHPFIEINNCVDDLHLIFNSKKIFYTDENHIPNGKSEKYDKFINLTQIKDTSFDSCFSLRKNGSIHFTKIHNKSNGLSVVLWQEMGYEKYNYLQIFIPPERDCIAIEPMTCMPNSFNNGEGLIILGSGDTFEAVYGIKII